MGFDRSRQEVTFRLRYTTALTQEWHAAIHQAYAPVLHAERAMRLIGQIANGDDSHIQLTPER